MSFILFQISAILEIIGSYFIIKFTNTKSIIDLVVGSLILIFFGLSLAYHNEDSGRVFASYGGVYIVSSLLWLKYFDGSNLTIYDLSGGIITILGAVIIYFQPH
jgi:small multidrug resistance family-3 protein